MANRNVFKTTTTAPVANTVNKAGGLAYSMTNEAALCQLAVTGTFNGTYYASAKEQLDEVKKLVESVNPALIAKIAIYAHERGKMKDMPAFLLAHLAFRGEIDCLRMAWPRVITTPKMLYNFVQITRSGVTGRKSFGTAVKNLIRGWIAAKNGNGLYRASIGASNPSLVDVLKMVHPKPVDNEQSALFAYLLGAKREGETLVHARGKRPSTVQNWEDLPSLLRHVHAFRDGDTTEAPNVDMRALTNNELTLDNWKSIALNMPWNTLRMNLNTLSRHGVFNDENLVSVLANKLRDPDEVRRTKAMPYSILTALYNIDAPTAITNALQDALEIATENVPRLGEKVAICIDLSGSMSNSITGNRAGSTSKVSCKMVAALMAASFMRTNDEATVIAWASRCSKVRLNPRDSVATNTAALSRVDVDHGTNAGLALQLLNNEKWNGDAIIYVSDNQSWMGNIGRWGDTSGTTMAAEWQKMSRHNKKVKLICVDLQPYTNVQVQDDNRVLNIGSFSDSCWDVIARFSNGNDANFVEAIENYCKG